MFRCIGYPDNIFINARAVGGGTDNVDKQPGCEDHELKFGFNQNTNRPVTIIVQAPAASSTTSATLSRIDHTLCLYPNN